jgi:hypothetical protein
MQVVVGPGRDGLLLEVLEAFERAIDLPRRRPACALAA